MPKKLAVKPMNGRERRNKLFPRSQWCRRTLSCLYPAFYDNFRQENTEMNHPWAIVNFDYQGNFSTFDPELLSVKTERYGDFILGNVLHDSLESACYTDKFQSIYRDMATGVELCRNSCEYFGVCGGGAGSNKFWENETFASTDTSACKYRIKPVTDIVLAELENWRLSNHQINKWKEKTILLTDHCCSLTQSLKH